MALESLDAEAIAEAIVLAGVAPLAATGAAAKVARFRADRGAEGMKRSWRLEQGGAAETFFDLASLTKPMTAVAVARAGIDPAAPLASFLPELAGTASAEVSLDLLLSHRAGLAPHVTIYAPLLEGNAIDRRDAIRVASESRREDAGGPIPAGGFAPVYSDMGYLLAGEALARATGATDAGEAIAKWVALPLGLDRELGTARELEAHGIDLVRLAAPTEDVAWRGGIVRGRVHDENAWAITGAGGSGHAGMFGTVRAVLAFGCAVLDAIESKTAPLGCARGLAWLVTPRPGGTLRAGFDGKSPEGSSAGALAGPSTFGHLGFTGTSLWIDPDAGAVVTLLTNRIHPTRENIAIRAARPGAHDALFARARVLAR
jgi:CubicO group peptidase (beta-lactamase class C family)